MRGGGLHIGQLIYGRWVNGTFNYTLITLTMFQVEIQATNQQFQCLISLSIE